MITHEMLNDSTSAESPVVPIEYAGQWIAWNPQGTQIVASGRTIQDAAQAAASAGEMQPVFAKVPKADVRFAGHPR
jgi:hypothetical protein